MRDVRMMVEFMVAAVLFVGFFSAIVWCDG